MNLADNCVAVSKNLLRQLNIQFTEQYLADSILSHADHPSLLAVSDTLLKYRIQSLAVKVEQEKLLNLPLPFIVQFSEMGGMFYVLENYSEEQVTIINENGEKN